MLIVVATVLCTLLLLGHLSRPSQCFIQNDTNGPILIVLARRKHQPINQSIDRSINQPTNQSIDQSIRQIESLYNATFTELLRFLLIEFTLIQY